MVLGDEIQKLGYIQAGFASPREEDLADTISIGEYLIRHPESSYLLEVTGRPFLDKGILAGDLVVFERGCDPRVGDLVIVLASEGYEIDYFSKYLGSKQVIGVVTASFRTYK